MATTLATMLVAACGLAIMLWEGLGAGSGYGNAMGLEEAWLHKRAGTILYKNSDDKHRL